MLAILFLILKVCRRTLSHKVSNRASSQISRSDTEIVDVFWAAFIANIFLTFNEIY